MCSGVGQAHRVLQELHASVCTGSEIAPVSELRADLWCELWQPGALALCLMIKASVICYLENLQTLQPVFQILLGGIEIKSVQLGHHYLNTQVQKRA